jgi:tetratricopeptide (TPR) repeat protein
MYLRKQRSGYDTHDRYAPPARERRALRHNGLGNVYYELRQYEAAQLAYRAAIELEPAYAQVHKRLGQIYYARGQHEAAVTAYRQAIILDPADA